MKPNRFAGGESRQVRTTLIVAALLLSVVTVRAQFSRPFERELRLGMIGGMNWNYVDIGAQKYIKAPEGSTLPRFPFIGSAAFGPFIGVQADYDLSRELGLHARLTYDNRSIDNGLGAASFHAHLSYLSIEPGVRLMNSGDIRIFLMAGPSLHLNLGSNYDFISGDPKQQPIEGAAISNATALTYGLWLSLGIDLPAPLGFENWYISPVIESSYLFNQVPYDPPASISVYADKQEQYQQWYTVTFRGGIGVKYRFDM